MSTNRIQALIVLVGAFLAGVIARSNFDGAFIISTILMFLLGMLAGRID